MILLQNHRLMENENTQNTMNEEVWSGHGSFLVFDRSCQWSLLLVVHVKKVKQFQNCFRRIDYYVFSSLHIINVDICIASYSRSIGLPSI